MWIVFLKFELKKCSHNNCLYQVIWRQANVFLCCILLAVKLPKLRLLCSARECFFNKTNEWCKKAFLSDLHVLIYLSYFFVWNHNSVNLTTWNLIHSCYGTADESNFSVITKFGEWFPEASVPHIAFWSCYINFQGVDLLRVKLSRHT